MTHKDFSEYREYVASLFNLIWLEQAGTHRLRKIWRRTDELAKIEVASLGFFIEQLYGQHKKWLTDTARAIRNQTQTAHGLIFEIVTLGSLAARGMNIQPMKKNHPAYDAEVTGQDGNLLRVSIKNHDLSMHEARFRFDSKRLANVVRRRVLASDGAWQAVIRSRTHLDAQAFEEIAGILRRSPIRPGELAPHLFPKRGASIQLRRLLHSIYRPGSYTCNVNCPQAAQEQTRFISNIDKAIQAFNKHSQRGRGHSNVIFMRVHGSADIEGLRRYAQEAISKPECSVDLIMFYQSIIGHNRTKQAITYYACDVVSPRYTGPNFKFPLQFISGEVVTRPLGRTLVDIASSGQLPVDDITGEYSYQQGHLFYRQNADRTFNNPPYVSAGLKETFVVEQPYGNVHIHRAFLEDEDLFLL